LRPLNATDAVRLAGRAFATMEKTMLNEPLGRRLLTIGQTEGDRNIQRPALQIA
jgi:hypothetical protein